METKIREIYYAFDGKLVGSKFMRWKVCETLALMPSNIIDFITKNCWFFSSMDDAWAFTFTGNDLANKHLILLGDDLLSQHAGQIRYSIAHEIGHVILKHKNSILEKQSKREINKQEKEADEFAKKYVEI